MTALRALAPAKINLGLVVGPVRTRDRRHEIASVMQSISLADEVVLEPGAAGEDEGMGREPQRPYRVRHR